MSTLEKLEISKTIQQNNDQFFDKIINVMNWQIALFGFVIAVIVFIFGLQWFHYREQFNDLKADAKEKIDESLTDFKDLKETVNSLENKLSALNLRVEDNLVIISVELREEPTEEETTTLEHKLNRVGFNVVPDGIHHYKREKEWGIAIQAMEKGDFVLATDSFKHEVIYTVIFRTFVKDNVVNIEYNNQIISLDKEKYI